MQKLKIALSPEFKQRKFHVVHRRQKTEGFPGCVCPISLWIGCVANCWHGAIRGDAGEAELVKRNSAFNIMT